MLKVFTVILLLYSKSEQVINYKFVPITPKIEPWSPNMTKKLLIEIKLVQESENTPNNTIINDIYSDIMEGRCIIPWCDTVQKIINIKA